MLLRRCALAVGVVLTFSPAAQADPVNLITSGFYSLAFGRDEDFRFLGNDFDIAGMASGGVRPLFTCRPCAPGTSIDLSTDFDAVLALEFPGILDGHSFSAGAVFFNGDMAFHTGRVIAPGMPPPPPDGGFTQASLSVPFAASGFLTAFDNIERAGPPIFSGAFGGQGTATVTFFNLPDFGMVSERVRYEFQEAAPTPEPATLVLLGTGLTAAYAGRRRRWLNTN